MIRVLATVIGLLALAVAVVGFAARYLPISGQPTLVLAAAAPYLALAAPVAVVLLGLGRRLLLTVLALVLTAAFVWVYVPRYLSPATPDIATVDLRVLTVNLGMGRADPAELTAIATESADVVAVQEMTAAAVDGLSAAGIDAVFPYRVVLPAPAASGVGIWSRHPIVNSGRIDGYTLPGLGTRIRVPGVVVDTTVLSVHIAAPWPQPIDGWKRDVARFPDTLREVGEAAGAGAVIVAGDFNSKSDMAPFRRLLDADYRDAGAETGAGLTRTYPARGWRPPLIGIDHILTKNCWAASVRTVVPGTDHRGLLATLALPVDMTSS